MGSFFTQVALSLVKYTCRGLTLESGEAADSEGLAEGAAENSRDWRYRPMASYLTILALTIVEAILFGWLHWHAPPGVFHELLPIVAMVSMAITLCFWSLGRFR